MAALILSMCDINDLTVDHNETAGTTTVTTPDGNCSITLDISDWDAVSNLPNAEEGDLEDTAPAITNDENATSEVMQG